MADLDNLRPEVRGLGPCKVCGTSGYPLSYGGTDICPACDCGVNPEVSKLKRELADARAELLRLGDENIALHDLVRHHSDCTELADTELAALKARIAKAPITSFRRAMLGTPHAWVEETFARPEWIGKRVRLVVEE